MHLDLRDHDKVHPSEQIRSARLALSIAIVMTVINIVIFVLVSMGILQ